MDNTRAIIRMMAMTGAVRGHRSESDRYDLQMLFRNSQNDTSPSECETLFPEGMNVENIKRFRSLNTNPCDSGYDGILEKFLRNVVSRRTFHF
jgi:hypothetical protein